MRKIYAAIGLLLVVVIVIAITSYLKENWSATGQPGRVETAMARWILRLSRQDAANEKNPLLPTEENLSKGEESYDLNCAFCHGSNGSGQSAVGLQFYPPVPSLRNLEVNLTDGQIHFVISKGVRYTAMPSFEKVLSAEEAWQVVLWVRNLAETKNPGNITTK